MPINEYHYDYCNRFKLSVTDQRFQVLQIEKTSLNGSVASANSLVFKVINIPVPPDSSTIK